MTDQEFRLAADRALAELQRSLLPLIDGGDCDLESRNGVLEITFDAPRAATFVVSPHTPARQIWVSAMSRSYRLTWTPGESTFTFDGEPLAGLVGRLAREHLAA